METIELKEASAMQKLALANDRLTELKAEIKRWQEEYDARLEEVLAASPKFGPSKFLKATKSKGDAYQADHVMLVRTPVVKRIIRQDEFIEKYPKEFMQIGVVAIKDVEAAIGSDRLMEIIERYPEIFAQTGVVAIKDAEAAIGSDRLMELCDLSTDYRYKVVRTEMI